jgi:hypothetical protein
LLAVALLITKQPVEKLPGLLLVGFREVYFWGL